MGYKVWMRVVEEQIRRILGGLGESVFIIDADRRILFANTPAENLFGRNLLGQDFVKAIRHPDCLQAINEVLTGGERSKTVVNLDSPVRATFEITVTVIGNSGGKTALVSLNDVTRIRDAEQMRSDFVANVSHELRSPLTTLAGFIETLKGPARGDEQATSRFLDLMEQEAGRMTRLIHDLLSLSKLESNERIRPTTKMEMNAVVKRVVANLAQQASHERKKIVLSVSKDVEPIPGDEDELTQVVQNILENSIKYGASDTEIRVSVGIRENIAGISGKALAIEVIDNSEGILPEHVPRLTERFYRVDASRSRDKGGTGLGLAIVKHIVKRHRGRLRIHSEPGIGSTFSVFLPVESQRL